MGMVNVVSLLIFASIFGSGQHLRQAEITLRNARFAQVEAVRIEKHRAEKQARLNARIANMGNISDFARRLNFENIPDADPVLDGFQLNPEPYNDHSDYGNTDLGA